MDVLFKTTQDKGEGLGCTSWNPPQAQWASGLIFLLGEDKRAMEYEVSCSLADTFSWQTLLFIPQQDGYGSLWALPYLEALGSSFLTEF